jgi:hypothetical protein
MKYKIGGRGSHKSTDFNTEEPRDFVALEWVEVKINNLPEVHFKISCSSEREKELIATLQKRLEKSATSGLKLFINDIQVL